jgi:hypothetical protein
MSRSGFKIKPTSHEFSGGDRIDWLDEFAEKIAKPKSAVEVARERTQQVSIYDQINSIVGNNPANRTVESVVRDYQDKVGLSDYLQRVSSEQDSKKVAALNPAEQQQQDPCKLASWDKFGPKMKNDLLSYCRNTIETHMGQITVPAVQHDILVTFQQHGMQPQDVNTDEVARCISRLITDELKKRPIDNNDNSDLGKGVGIGNDVKDDGDDDFLSGLLTAIK